MCKQSVVRSVPFFVRSILFPDGVTVAFPFHSSRFSDRMVNRKTIVFLKRNVNFLLTGAVGKG